MRGKALRSLVLTAILAGSAARAEPPAEAGSGLDARDRARAEFRVGVALARSALHAESCAAFERSLELLPHAATLYNLAQSELALGRVAAASHHLRAALGRDASTPELEPATRALAAERLAELDARVVRVTISPPVSRATIAVDGHPVWVEEDAAGVRLTPRSSASGTTAVSGGAWMLIVDPGRHLVEVAVADTRQLLELNELPGARLAWGVERFPLLAKPSSIGPLPAAIPVAQPRATTRPTPAAPRAAAAQSSPSSRARPTLETAAWVLAGVGVGTTALFGSLALRERAELADACPQPSRCPLGTDVEGRRESIERFATLADIGLAAALLGAGGGVTLRLMGTGGAVAQVAGHF